ncbi:MAG: Brp/Blh family beta-carotene 15,15'-dioxygenase [Verrucomicrobiota bacterium]
MEVWPALIFLSTLVLLGMPHGAIDHYLYFHLTQQPFRTLSLLIFVLIYLLFSFLMAGLWILFPAVCVCGLIGLTWAHWGEGDMIFERAQGHPVSWFFGLWRGSLPMLVPIVLYSENYRSVLHAGMQVVDPDISPASFEWLQSPQLLAVVVALLVLIGVLSWFFILIDSGFTGRLKWRWLGEEVVLVVFFLMLPPLASIGLYFSLWHARRHIRVSCRELGPPVWTETGIDWPRFYLWAAPFTVAGILLMSLLPVFYLKSEDFLMFLVGSYLITLWSFTWPHAVICRLLHKKLSF